MTPSPETLTGGTAPSGEPVERVIAPTTAVRARARDLVRYRELLGNLVRKELKVKYKNSALGFFWSMLNPALYLVIFWLVFTKFLGGNVPMFPIFFLAGLLAWNLLSNSLGGAVGSVVGNSSLVTKVFFPREVLPLAAIGASLVHFVLQLVVLVGALGVFRWGFAVEGLLLVPAALVALVVFLVGMSLLVAVANVYFRDVQHLLELVLLAWFWMTPIVYPIVFVQNNMPPALFRIYLLNPMTHIVLAFQRGVYGHVSPPGADGNPIPVLVDAPLTWYLRNIGIVGVGAILIVLAGWFTFQRLESRLAEEL